MNKINRTKKKKKKDTNKDNRFKNKTKKVSSCFLYFSIFKNQVISTSSFLAS